MILIDNLKKIRKLNYISEFNIELKKYKYILICDSNLIIYDSKINFLKSNIKFIFLKNIKCINFLLKNKVKNSVLAFLTNDLNDLNFLLSNLKNSVLFIKLDNNFYSVDLNNVNSIFDLLNYLNNYYFNFLNIININFEKKKCI